MRCSMISAPMSRTCSSSSSSSSAFSSSSCSWWPPSVACSAPPLACCQQTGAGFTHLVHQGDEGLDIRNTRFQDNPLHCSALKISISFDSCSILLFHDDEDFQTKPDLSGVMVAVSADQQSLSQLTEAEDIDIKIFIFYNSKGLK